MVTAPTTHGTVLSAPPYLLRAMHEWMGDAGYTPHIIVEAGRSGVEVPDAYIKDGKIVLNVSINATQRLQLRNDGIEFDARFAGVVHHMRVPMAAVLGIYARETGEGMVFSDQDLGPEPPPQPLGRGRRQPALASEARQVAFNCRRPRCRARAPGRCAARPRRARGARGALHPSSSAPSTPARQAPRPRGDHRSASAKRQASKPKAKSRLRLGPSLIHAACAAS